MKPPIYYPIAIRLAMPIYRYMVHKKSQHLPTYMREVKERFGQTYLPAPTAVHIPVDNLEKKVNKSGCHGRVIWCHAVSLGELNTAYPMLKILLNQGFNLWITSTTQTGFNRASVLFEPLLGTKVNHSFVPVDNLKTIQVFIEHIQPVMALFIETELWANTLYELRQRQIPAVMVNARLTEKSYQSYAKFPKLSTSMMQNLTAIIAQDEASADRFVRLGADKVKVSVMDSLKWSSVHQLSADNQRLIQQVQIWQGVSHRPIWLVGSTHDAEELLAIQAHKKLIEHDPATLLILVPRHPERFDEVASLCQSSTFITHRRSKGERIDPDTQVYLADSMGELLAWYAVCDVAVVGGSFVDVGGHNPIEPAALAKPVVMGKFIKNCEELVDGLSKVSALTITDSASQCLADAVASWLFDEDAAHQAGMAGRQLVVAKENAATKQAEQLLIHLSITDSTTNQSD
ncbi:MULTISPECIES: 3-deoxy-D-manno-octulosonic acid transferase [unclassified Moraxella]|uniref:3-deoxy-D-manno-octulosonic acid transferase n=1 Tax=unclassified Moraxella TaxID=2685852 RepID=UPI00359E8ECF